MSIPRFSGWHLHSSVRVATCRRVTPIVPRCFSSRTHLHPSQPGDSRPTLARASTTTSSTSIMSKRQTSSSATASTKPKSRPPPSIPRPSSSILLLSPTNQVLLLHRVRTSTSFASAHVFPGGNLSSYHEGPIPEPDSPARHVDGKAYRLAAIRETFEESGILLARGDDGGLLDVSDDVREEGRRKVHAGEVRFPDWVQGLGGVADVDNLIPFTRWITPTNVPKRFTTQMYLYMLPISSPISATTQETIIPVPTHDGGLEHTAATFDSISTWLARAKSGDIILFPPQLYLLTLLSRFISPGSADYASQRQALTSFLATTPTSSAKNNQDPDPTALIPWADKVMSPTGMFMLPGDGRLVLGLDKPGPELAGSGRGGDRERVVLVEFAKGGPRRVEVRGREEVLRIKRAAEREEGGKGKL